MRVISQLLYVFLFTSEHQSDSDCLKPEARVSLLRKAFKDASVNAIVGPYGLSNGCSELVAKLLFKSNYIYILKVRFIF